MAVLRLWSFSTGSFLRKIVSSCYVSCAQLSSKTAKVARIQSEPDDGILGDELAEYSAAKPFSSIPTPREAWPVIGLLPEARKRMGKAGDDNLFHYLTHLYGSIWRTKAFGLSLVIINDPKATEVVMRSEGKWPSRSAMIEDNFQWIHRKNNVPDGLVFSSGKNWKRLRSAIAKQVIPRRLSNFTSALYSVADDLCDHLASSRSQEGEIADIWPSMQNWALKGVSRVVFNEDIDVHSGKDPMSRELVEAAVAFNASISRIQGSSPLYKIIPTKPYRQYVQSLQRMRTVGAALLKKHYDDISSDIGEGRVDETTAVGLLDQWLIEGQLTEHEAMMQAADMLSAGTDTTSNTATFLLHELAKNPHIQKAVWREVMEAVGADKEPMHEQLQQLPLVRGCVREILRLYPITMLNSRVMEKDIVLMGYQIPAGTIAAPITSLPGFDPNFFPNPDQFDPHRWSKKAKEIHPFAAIPFGFGPRSCYGRRIAELELHLLLVRVLQRFELSTNQSSLELKRFLVLQPAEPVMVQFIDRKN